VRVVSQSTQLTNSKSIQQHSEILTVGEKLSLEEHTLCQHVGYETYLQSIPQT
jgi:hypothetical protein